MKAKLLLTGVAAMTFASVAMAGPLVSNKTVDIILQSQDGSFDYCDGMQLVINQNTQIVGGQRTGCVTDAANGIVGSFSKNGMGVAMMTTDGYAAYLFVIDDNPRKWEIYLSDGTLLNSGIYKVGIAPSVGGDGSTTAKK
ncbi:MAG: hypothetical protein LZF61_02600 [Nitrosomonas sp.]|nr:MAG: hypothetical protein LZF61_02600 [Nitrosomonas sp.]